MNPIMSRNSVIVLAVLWVCQMRNGCSQDPCPTECSCNLVTIDEEVGWSADCRFKNLDAVPFFNPEAKPLLVLNLIGNNIANTTGINVPHLKELYLAENSITNRADSGAISFDGIAQSLQILNLGSNPLTHYPLVLSDLEVLKRLDLYNAGISSINSDAFRQQTGTLQILNLGDNALSEIPTAIQNLTSLEQLLLYGNQIDFVDGSLFQNLRSLKILNLGKNKLATVPYGLDMLPKLGELLLYGNLISNISLKAFVDLPLLTRLNLGNNRLTEVPNAIQSLSNLEILELYENDIITIDRNAFDGQTRTLSKLNLGANRLSTIPDAVQDLTKLAQLDLYENTIWHSDPDVFKNHQNSLTRLNLDSNRLTYLPKSIRNLRHLSRLVISNNLFQSLEKCLFGDLPKLEFLLLGPGNNWNCDCKLAFLRALQLTAPDPEYTGICATPSKYKGKSYLQYSVQECQETDLSLQACNALPTTHAQSITPVWVWAIVACVVAIMFVALFTVFLVRRRRSKRRRNACLEALQKKRKETSVDKDFGGQQKQDPHDQYDITGHQAATCGGIKSRPRMPLPAVTNPSEEPPEYLEILPSTDTCPDQQNRDPQYNYVLNTCIVFPKSGTPEKRVVNPKSLVDARQSYEIMSPYDIYEDISEEQLRNRDEKVQGQGQGHDRGQGHNPGSEKYQNISNTQVAEPAIYTNI